MSVEGIKRQDVKEYRKIDMLSSTDLRAFATNRKKFFNERILGVVDEDDDDYNRSEMIGNLSHCLLLEPHMFDERYFMSTCPEVPTANMLKFVEALYKHTALNTNEEGVVTASMEDLTKLAYTDSGYKITLPAVLKKFTDKSEAGVSPEDYYRELREVRMRGLIVVCTADLQIAEAIVEKVRGNQFTGPIFNSEEDTFNEMKVENIIFRGVPMKGMLDRVKVYHENKTIQLYDFKAVWNNQGFFYEYYLKKMAYIQALIYYTALYLRKADLGFDYSEYTILPPIFVVADSGNFYDPLQYKLTEEDLERALGGFEINGRKYRGAADIMDELQWCMNTGQWKMGKEAYEAEGIVRLK